ncbi:MAG: hypothetical protein ABI204_10125 [Ginsengibacter sp.]
MQCGSELRGFVLARIEVLKSIPFGEMLKEYNSHLWSRGKVIKLKKGEEVFETRILGVSKDGELLTEGGGGDLARWNGWVDGIWKEELFNEKSIASSQNLCYETHSNKMTHIKSFFAKW